MTEHLAWYAPLSTGYATLREWAAVTDPITKWMFPELARFETAEQRRVAWQEAHRQSRLLCALIVGLGAGIGTGFLVVLLDIFFGRIVAVSLPAVAKGCLAGGVAGAAAGYIGWWPVRGRIRRSLRQQLTEAGIPTCVPCGYDLRGQIEPRCPECGTPFDDNAMGNE